MSDKMLSVILLSYYSEKRILNVYNAVAKELDGKGISFEFIIMDDGSKDNSFKVAKKLSLTENRVRAYRLSRNYTSHYSIFAGLSICKGSCATIIPDDEQQPYSLLTTMYRKWENGEKIIIPHRDQRHDKLYLKLTSNFFYTLMNRFSQINFPKGGADSFLIDREIIDIINNRIKPINTTSISEILRLGFDPCFIPFQRDRGTNNKSRWTLKKKIRLAKDFFFSSSNAPIKLISNLGIFFSGISLLIILFYIYLKLFGNPDFWKISVPGWVSLVVLISFFSGLILFSLGIIAEYIWRIYEEVKNRPGYIIRNDEE